MNYLKNQKPVFEIFEVFYILITNLLSRDGFHACAWFLNHAHECALMRMFPNHAHFILLFFNALINAFKQHNIVKRENKKKILIALPFLIAISKDRNQTVRKFKLRCRYKSVIIATYNYLHVIILMQTNSILTIYCS